MAVQDPAVVFISSAYPSAPQVVEATNPDEYGIFTSLDNPRERANAEQGKRMFRKGFRTVTWRASDDNGDTLRYSLSFRAEGQRQLAAPAREHRRDADQLRHLAAAGRPLRAAPHRHRRRGQSRRRRSRDVKDGVEFQVDNTAPKIDVGSRAATTSSSASPTQLSPVGQRRILRRRREVDPHDAGRRHRRLARRNIPPRPQRRRRQVRRSCAPSTRITTWPRQSVEAARKSWYGRTGCAPLTRPHRSRRAPRIIAARDSASHRFCCSSASWRASGREKPVTAPSAPPPIDRASRRTAGRWCGGSNLDIVHAQSGLALASRYDRYVANYLFTPLVYLDRNLQPIPGLADSWEISDDGLTYRFKLNKKATFSERQAGARQRMSCSRCGRSSIRSPRRCRSHDAFEQSRPRRKRTPSTITPSRSCSASAWPRSSSASTTSWSSRSTSIRVGDFRKDFIATRRRQRSVHARAARRRQGDRAASGARTTGASGRTSRRVIFKVDQRSRHRVQRAASAASIDETLHRLGYVAARAQQSAAARRIIDFQRFYTLNYNYIAWNGRNPILQRQARPPGACRCASRSMPSSRALSRHRARHERAVHARRMGVQPDRAGDPVRPAGRAGSCSPPPAGATRTATACWTRTASRSRFDLIVMTGSATLEAVRADGAVGAEEDRRASSTS